MTYQVEWREVGSETLTGTASGVETLYYDATGLVPIEDYEWRVRETDGTWSDWLSFTTLEFLLTADGIDGAATLETGALTQTHILAADGIAGAAELGRPALTQSIALTTDGIAASGKLDAGALTQTHLLAAENIESHGVLDRFSIFSGAAHELTTAGIDAHADLGTVALVQHHYLTTDGITAHGALDTGALIHTHALAARELSAWAEFERGSLAQTHTLAAADLEAQAILDLVRLILFMPAPEDRTIAIPDTPRTIVI